MFRHRIVPAFAFAVAVAALASIALGDKKQEEQMRREYHARLKAIEHEESVIRRQIQQLEKQVPEVKKQLQATQQVLQVMAGQAQAAKAQLDEAKAETKRMSQKLDDVAEEVIAGKPADSPVGKARAAGTKAKKAYTDAIDAIKHSKAFKEAYQRATSEGTSPKIVAQLRKQWFDNDPTVIDAREQLAKARREYETLRLETLRNDPDWKRAASNLKATKEQEQRTDDQTKSVLGRYATAQRRVTITKRNLGKLQAKIQQGHRALNSTVNFKNNFKRQYGHLGKK